LGWFKISFRHLSGAGEDGESGRDQAVIDIEMTHPNLPALPEYLPLWRGEMKDSTIPSGGLVEKAGLP